MRHPPLPAASVAMLLLLLLAPSVPAQQAPAPPGKLVDIGGELLHVHCTGRGGPTVLLENGTGDFSVVWSLVQPRVAQFTRVCSYDRAGYAWSQPGRSPRTFAQLALELRTALRKLQVRAPFILVGQSYGGLVVRGFAAQYPSEIAGMVLVDAVHEDQHVVWGGQPHRIRDGARGRTFVSPLIALDRALLAQFRDSIRPTSNGPLDSPLDQLPADAQAIWRWAESHPLARAAQSAEADWSPEELSRFHEQRLTNRTTLKNLPLIVLARTEGGYDSGMAISADSL
jgi:pimeloyl-ACP methyl ester carboxylesterase